jgi:hypothetical protein
MAGKLPILFKRPQCGGTATKRFLSSKNGRSGGNPGNIFRVSEKRVVCDYFVISSISLSIVHVSVVSFKPTAGVQPSVL